MSSSSDQQQQQPQQPASTAAKEDEDGSVEEGTLLRQTLMTHDECFVYKVPPLATASGYKANDWNLASPVQTCGFQVERRNNSLYLLFTLEHHTKLFAISCIDASQPIIRSVEPVTDSSRYFVCQIIQGGNNASTRGGSSSRNSGDNTQKQMQKPKTALLGFGFRDRDVAIDLLGNLQQFTKSIERERQAKNMKVQSIPTLQEGQKIHIEIKGMKKKDNRNTHQKKIAGKTTDGGSSGGPFLLLKKPPKSSSTKDGGGSGDDGSSNTGIPAAGGASSADVVMSSSSLPIDKLKIDEGVVDTTAANTDGGGGGGDSGAGGFDDDDEDDFGDFQGA